MKKIFLTVSLLVTGFVFSQTPKEKINNYLTSNKSQYSLSQSDISNWVVESTGSSKATGINNYYLKQTVSGIEIHNTTSNVWVKNNEVINAKMRFIPNAITKINTISPSINVLEALNYAHTALKEPKVTHEILKQEGNKYHISNGELSDAPVTANLVFQAVEDNLYLAWRLDFYSQNYSHLWSVSIDALNGNLLDKQDGVLTCNFGDANHQNHNHQNFFFTKKGFKENISSLANVQSGSYRVYPYYIESPNHGNRQLLASPHNTTASPNGWHDTNGFPGADYTITRGNNVYAKEDIAGNNGTGNSPDGGAGLLFDYPYGGVGVPASTYTDASVTNLFYMNNIMHDVWYHYGFDPENGNFQQTNLFSGGLGNDYVIADAQDGSGINNANFSTPADGSNPRMQMFLWNQGPLPEYLTINSPASIAGGYYVSNNVFDPGNVALPVAPGLTTDLVLFQDAIADISDGCSSAVNATAINGKIVVIRRGECNFTVKVLNAQNAGAVAVIVVNNDSANPNTYVNMSGAEASITIPAVFINYNYGEAIISAMQSGTVNATLKDEPVTFVNADGDFDNGIIAHEYGHGISTRLTGGPATSCLNSSEQMGEGWSDFFALMMQMKAGDTGAEVRGIATFAVSQPTNGVGIRPYPYSTDMTINPLTFASTNNMTYTDTNGDEQINIHSVGTVWASALWDLAWAYVEKYGFDADIYTGTGGNNKVMQLVLDGLKLQGCNPSFVSGRDALIAADQATTGGEDYCMIWEVFARRGLGINASSGTNIGVPGIQDQVEDFTEPSPGPNCTLSATYFENSDMIKIYPNPSNGLVNVKIVNYSGAVTIQLYDLNGREVYSKNIEYINNEEALDLHNLQSGVYLVKINGNELSFSQKLILN